MRVFLQPGAFRLLLASAVVVGHTTRLDIGTAAVMLFFMLSGFWIDRMYDRHYAPKQYPALVFMASRLMRLMPMFLLFNLVAILLHQFLGTKVAIGHAGFDELPNIVMLGYASMAERPLVPAWSLDIELQFYLLFPFLRPLLPKQGAFRLWLPLLLAAAGAIYLAIYLRHESRIVLPYIGFFAIGICASRADWRPPTWLVGTGAATAALGAAFLLALPATRTILLAVGNPADHRWNFAADISLALLLAPLALETVWRPSPPSDRIAGDLSYVVYCAHWIAVVLLAYYLPNAPWRIKLPFALIAVAVTYATSLIVLLWIDRPLGRMRDVWIKRQRNDTHLPAT